MSLRAAFSLGADQARQAVANAGRRLRRRTIARRSRNALAVMAATMSATTRATVDAITMRMRSCHLCVVFG